MKKIIGNLLYDTEKAKLIDSFRKRMECSKIYDVIFYEWYNADIYKTENENYFIHYYVKDKPTYKEILEESTEQEVKEIIKKVSPNKFIEMYPEDIEEA